MPPADNITRLFLGTASPALPTAARWLVDELADGSADLGDTLVVVPGGRAQRRLVELLAEQAAGRALVPPTIVTLGALVDRLLPDDGPAIASDLATLLAWATVMREAEPDLITAAAPRPPQRDDWPGWWALAEQVTRAADELGAQLMLLSDVPDRLTHAGDTARWAALSELDRRVHDRLAEQGCIGRHRARRDAIEAGACRAAGPVVLLATADLQPVHERALACLATPVIALVFADERDAEGFDPFGGLVTPYWAERPIPLADDAIVFVDRPSDQAAAVLDAVRGWADAAPTPADDITVGLGDASLDGPIARTLELAGLPTRSAAGRPMGRSRPVLLLQALAGFAQRLRFDKLAALLRHPDAEHYAARQTGAPTRPWLTLLDRYADEHLAQRPAAGWLGDAERAAELDAVYRTLRSLLPEPVHALRPLSAWPAVIGDALSAIYGGRTLNRFADDDRPVVAALDAIGDVLEQLAALDAQTAPRCTAAQAMTLVASRVAGQPIPEPGGEPAIERVGFLELLLDDAPRLIVAGVNESHIPAPPRGSTLLPQGVRNDLGLPDDTLRLARDGYTLAAITACRDDARLIAGRQSLDGDPLMPSRLLLHADDDTMVRRVSNFVDTQGYSADAPILLTPGKHDRFLIPRPVLPDTPITSLRVTAFRDYLACPYRFYLKHVRKLAVLDDRAVELNAGRFGTLAHDALRVLAQPGLVEVSDPAVIAEHLSATLDQRFAERFGVDPPVAARIQAEQLRYRLDALAREHARLVQAGWRIAHHELSRSAAVEVDGEPFTITGQIDRIDRHVDGGWRLIDYKTADTAKRSEQTHRQRVDGVVRWADLQLPLYLDLSAGLGVGPSAELGYFNLPKSAGDCRYEPAAWTADDLQSAWEQRDFVIRQVRAGVFWPPAMRPPSFDDGLSGVCADHAPDRARLLHAAPGGDGGTHG